LLPVVVIVLTVAKQLFRVVERIDTRLAANR